MLAFCALGLAASVGAFVFHPVFGLAVSVVSALLAGWCIWFFRDPARRIPTGSRLVISPADGVVVAVDQVPPPPEVPVPEQFRNDCRRVSVFMNVFDVHVNRAPVEGRILSVMHRAGKFFNASLQKASLENERSSMVLETPARDVVVAVQIAGLVARRIVSRVREGGQLRKGERYGLIRFGSRVDVFVPAAAHVLVTTGMKTRAGETVLAEFPAEPTCPS